jgi:hypothetical protein
MLTRKKQGARIEKGRDGCHKIVMVVVVGLAVKHTLNKRMNENENDLQLSLFH